MLDCKGVVLEEVEKSIKELYNHQLKEIYKQLYNASCIPSDELCSLNGYVGTCGNVAQYYGIPAIDKEG